MDTGLSSTRRTMALGTLAAITCGTWPTLSKAGDTASGSSGAVNGQRYANQSNIALRFRWPKYWTMTVTQPSTEWRTVRLYAPDVDPKVAFPSASAAGPQVELFVMPDDSTVAVIWTFIQRSGMFVYEPMRFEFGAANEPNPLLVAEGIGSRLGYISTPCNALGPFTKTLTADRADPGFDPPRKLIERVTWCNVKWIGGTGNADDCANGPAPGF